MRENERGELAPALRIFPRCVNLIRTLPLLRYDERRPADCESEPHELTHAPDALRGFCVYRVQSAQPPAPRPAEKLAARLRRLNGRQIIR